MKKLLIAVLLFLPTVSFAQIPDFPMAFWGEVTVGGVEAPVGSVVRVYDDTEKVGEVVVEEAGVYGHTEPTKQKLLLSDGVGELTFTIESSAINSGVETEGLNPITYSGFVSGETVELDLDFTPEAVVVEEPPRSSGGGGGGGSSRSRDDGAEEQVLGVTDVSLQGLSEEEIKIELQKQIIVLLTQLISLLKAQLGV